MDLNARAGVNFERKDGWTDGMTDEQTENGTPICSPTGHWDKRQVI